MNSWHDMLWWNWWWCYDRNVSASFNATVYFHQMMCSFNNMKMIISLLSRLLFNAFFCEMIRNTSRSLFSCLFSWLASHSAVPIIISSFLLSFCLIFPLEDRIEWYSRSAHAKELTFPLSCSAVSFGWIIISRSASDRDVQDGSCTEDDTQDDHQDQNDDFGPPPLPLLPFFPLGTPFMTPLVNTSKV